MESPREEDQGHIVMFPFMAQGHLIPFLALAKLVAARFPSLAVTLVNTRLNIQSLSSSLDRSAHPNIHLTSLPFCSADHGLPPDAENTDSLSIPDIIRLFQASESLSPHFARLVSGLHPSLIIADVFLGWTVEIAREHGISHATFTTCGAYGTTSYFSLWLNLPHTSTDSPYFHVPGFPNSFRLHRSQLSSYMRVANGNDPCSVFFRRHISLSLETDGMICNTVEGMEIEGLRLLREFTGLPIWPVGPLLPLDSGSSSVRSGKKSGMEVKKILAWLDSHKASSVVYISFGSQNTISSPTMMGLATGLELSGHPFVWVVRPPTRQDPNTEFQPEWLPEGFEERMKEKNRGLLVRRWAPQLEILSHESVGAFLSHCGWNSILESLSRGKAILCWPLASEQFYNSKMLEEELGVAVELARGVEDKVASEEVESTVRLVMEGEKGKEMKAKAMKLKETIREAMREEGGEKGSSLTAVDEFMATMLSSRKEN